KGINHKSNFFLKISPLYQKRDSTTFNKYANKYEKERHSDSNQNDVSRSFFFNF
ncbi:MAG: hypothetical protein ACI97N_001837, partial [Cognaticolwellia sp.]